ncbi:MAG: hypothetical protein ACJ72O_00320 [Marmoricola sp.]
MAKHYLGWWIPRLVVALVATSLTHWGNSFWAWAGTFMTIALIINCIGLGKRPRRELTRPHSGEETDVMLLDVGPRELDVMKVYREFSDRSFDEIDSLIEDGPIPASLGVSLTVAEAEELVRLITKNGGRAEIIRR